MNTQRFMVRAVVFGVTMIMGALAGWSEVGFIVMAGIVAWVVDGAWEP